MDLNIKLRAAYSIFTDAMMQRLREKEEEGYTGWDTIAPDIFEQRAIEKIRHGAYIDAANLCMFLMWQKLCVVAGRGGKV